MFEEDLAYQSVVSCIRHVTWALLLETGDLLARHVETAYATGHIQVHGRGWTCLHFTRWDRSRRATPILPRFRRTDLAETESDEELPMKRLRAWD